LKTERKEFEMLAGRNFGRERRERKREREREREIEREGGERENQFTGL
jgi:hypothetical protein